MVGADRGLENGRKDQDVHPLSPFLPCCGFGSGWVSVSVAISLLCTSLTWFQLLFSSHIPSCLEVIMTFCWVVPGSITYTCSLNSAHTFVNILFPLWTSVPLWLQRATLCKLLNYFVPLFSHLQSGVGICVYHVGLIVYVNLSKSLTKYFACNNIVIIFFIMVTISK